VSELFSSPDSIGNREPSTGELESVSGVDDVVRSVNRLEELGQEGLLKAFDAQLPVEHRLALLLCGLSEESLTVERPSDFTAGTAQSEGEERKKKAQ
jgi:hypothetical protein